MYNRVILIGRLTKAPELRYTQQGTPVATFTLAVDRRKTEDGQHEADFIPIVVWSKLAEICANNLDKGRLVLVDGRLQVRSYEGKDGQNRRVTEVIANEVKFLDHRKQGETQQAEEAGDYGPEMSF